jgi:hypothetical protein
MKVRQYLKTIGLNFEGKYFGKKQVHNFRTSSPPERCCSKNSYQSTVTINTASHLTSVEEA